MLELEEDFTEKVLKVAYAFNHQSSNVGKYFKADDAEKLIRLKQTAEVLRCTTKRFVEVVSRGDS